MRVAVLPRFTVDRAPQPYVGGIGNALCRDGLTHGTKGVVPLARSSDGRGGGGGDRSRKSSVKSNCVRNRLCKCKAARTCAVRLYLCDGPWVPFLLGFLEHDEASNMTSWIGRKEGERDPRRKRRASHTHTLEIRS